MKQFTIEAGSVIHIGGLPFYLVHNTTFEGEHQAAVVEAAHGHSMTGHNSIERVPEKSQQPPFATAEYQLQRARQAAPPFTLWREVRYFVSAWWDFS